MGSPGSRAWSFHTCLGLRLRGVLRMLAIAHPSVLPSAMRNDVGTPVAIISQLNTQPACAPVNASPAALRLPTHDSGSGWLATPFLCDSFIHNSTPVYPGALRNLLESSEGERRSPSKDHASFARRPKRSSRDRAQALGGGRSRLAFMTRATRPKLRMRCLA